MGNNLTYLHVNLQKCTVPLKNYLKIKKNLQFEQKKKGLKSSKALLSCTNTEFVFGVARDTNYD